MYLTTEQRDAEWSVITGRDVTGHKPVRAGEFTEVPPTAGVKHDGEKPDMSLLSPDALAELAQVLTFGAKKYARDNWRGGIKESRLLGALLRHTLAYMNGESEDPETGLSHIAHAMCNCMFLIEQHKRRPELDDRYKAPSK